MKRYFTFIILLLLACNLVAVEAGANCDSGTLKERMRCLEKFGKTAKKLLIDYLELSKKVEADVNKLISDEANCREFKLIYQESGYTMFRSKVEFCDGPAKTDMLRRYSKISEDYKFLRNFYPKLKVLIKANKHNLSLVEYEYKLMIKNQREIDDIFNGSDK